MPNFATDFKTTNKKKTIMKSIVALVNENRNEAYELIKQAGGRIDFVDDIIKGSTDDSKDDWNGCPSEYDLPWVVTGYDEGLIDTVVLAVKLGEEEGHIEFLAYDADEWKCNGWISYADCCSNTDNEVYMFIEEWIRDHKK